MPRKQEPITAEDLNDLESLCTWLDTQRYKAAYCYRYVCDPAYRDLRSGVIFWSSGHGWRLHTDWRRALAAKRARLTNGAVVAKSDT
jgi:hypothetical protein